MDSSKLAALDILVNWHHYTETFRQSWLAILFFYFFQKFLNFSRKYMTSKYFFSAMNFAAANPIFLSAVYREMLGKNVLHLTRLNKSCARKITPEFYISYATEIISTFYKSYGTKITCAQFSSNAFSSKACFSNPIRLG